MARPYDYVGKETFAISPNNKDWIWFPAKSLKDSDESLASEDSGRTLDGVMHIYWVQRDLKKVEIVLPPCTYHLIANLKAMVQGKEYYIRYKSMESADYITRHVYTSNLSANMYSGVLYNGLWQDFEFHAIELGD